MAIEQFYIIPRCKDNDLVYRNLPQDIIFDTEFRAWFENFRTKDFLWLDIGCGSGRMLHQFANVFDKFKDRIKYFGFDVDKYYTSMSKQAADSIGVEAEVKVGGIQDLGRIYNGRQFTGITLVNVIHEIPINYIPDLLLDIMLLCEKTGSAFVFDIESIPYGQPEPGALTWRIDDVKSVLEVLAGALDAKHEIQVFPYVSTQGAWYFFLEHRKFRGDCITKIESKREKIIEQLTHALAETFRNRLENMNKNLREQCYELQMEQVSLSSVPEGNKRITLQKKALEKVRIQLDTKFRDFWACFFKLSPFIG